MDANNPLSDREKALENEYIRKKEIQMAKERAAKKQAGSGRRSPIAQGSQDVNKDK
ncbi:hypothetical protein QC762_001610 [Podospora pseudocomata]|uniref:Uncharacterized protein n=1 Tax=Podospora pseudocomata TaxID=2093779 RepID=A0ABR0GAZ2_9PEZI|nr:hypothetical protein QC762_001610 [Podospora pseudocomata]